MKRNRFLLGCCVLILCPTLAIAIDPTPPFSDPVQQERYERLIREIRCLVCQNEPIADSSAPLAADLRREVRERMQAGANDQEIMAFLTARYGDFVLYRPPFQPNTWLLWLAPLLLLGIGGTVFVCILRERASRPMEDDDMQHEEGYS